MQEKLLLILFLFLFNGFSFAQTVRDSVTVTGRVTDYEGRPLDSVSVSWKNAAFGNLKEAITDENGYYSARIPKGKYRSMAAINMSVYPHTAKPDLPEKDQRLEFWAWDFIADRDTTLDIRYHRMEAYGIRVFRIPGAMPAWQIYVRPMSLSRFFQMKEKQSLQYARQTDGIEQEAIREQARAALLAPGPEKLKAVVWIDGEEVPILMKQEIKEYYEAGAWGNAYLLTVDRPRKTNGHLPYLIFKIELTDLENGDRGEGLYYMEKENYLK